MHQSFIFSHIVVCVWFFIALQLFDKLLADKCMIIISFTKQSRNNSKTAVTVTLNIDDTFNVFVHKFGISSMTWIFGKGGKGGSLLMQAPLKTLILRFWSWEIQNFFVNMFKIRRRLYRWIVTRCWFDLLRRTFCFYRLRH